MMKKLRKAKRPSHSRAIRPKIKISKSWFKPEKRNEGNPLKKVSETHEKATFKPDKSLLDINLAPLTRHTLVRNIPKRTFNFPLTEEERLEIRNVKAQKSEWQKTIVYKNRKQSYRKETDSLLRKQVQDAWKEEQASKKAQYEERAQKRQVKNKLIVEVLRDQR